MATRTGDMGAGVGNRGGDIYRAAKWVYDLLGGWAGESTDRGKGMEGASDNAVHSLGAWDRGWG